MNIHRQWSRQPGCIWPARITAKNHSETGGMRERALTIEEENRARVLCNRHKTTGMGQANFRQEVRDVAL